METVERIIIGALYAAAYWGVAWVFLHIVPAQSDPVEVLMGLVTMFGFLDGTDTVRRSKKS